MGHYTNLMEENEGPDPEIPSSPPQPFTNPEPSKPPMVYFSNLLETWQKRKEYLSSSLWKYWRQPVCKRKNLSICN